MNDTSRGPAWVVAADQGRARLFCSPVPTAPLQEIEDLVNAPAHQHERDLVSDRPGRVAKHALGESRAVGEQDTHKHRAAEQFAQRVCERLSVAHRSGQLGRLYLIAAPEFLGMLRHHLDRGTAACIAVEVNKDVTRASPEELRKLLPAAL